MRRHQLGPSSQKLTFILLFNIITYFLNFLCMTRCMFSSIYTFSLTNSKMSGQELGIALSRRNGHLTKSGILDTHINLFFPSQDTGLTSKGLESRFICLRAFFVSWSPLYSVRFADGTPESNFPESSPQPMDFQ